MPVWRHSKRCWQHLLVAHLCTWLLRLSAPVLLHVEGPLKSPVSATSQPRWQCSNMGRCRRLDGTITSGHKAAGGYHVVCIQNRLVFVHCLVKFSHHGPPKDWLASEINHLDGNKSNNRLDNLEYATPQQNIRHYYKSPLRGAPGRPTSVRVRCRSVGSNSWKVYSSMSEAASALGISQQSVAGSCRKGTVVKGFQCQRQESKESILKGEEWKGMIDPKTGCALPGRMVSSLGRFKGKAGTIFTGCEREDGYFTTTLKILPGSEHRRNVLIHQLVARAFLWPPPTPLHTQVHHKDGNRGHNCVTNLEYVTPGQNVAHSYKNKEAARLTSKARPVQSRRKGSSGPWRQHRSQTEAAVQLRLHKQCISCCLKGKYKQTGGYEFRELPPTPDLPGEVWRDVNMTAFFEEKTARKAWQSKRRKERGRGKALS